MSYGMILGLKWLFRFNITSRVFVNNHLSTDKERLSCGLLVPPHKLILINKNGDDKSLLSSILSNIGVTS